MAYMINDACISCGACEAECPVECMKAIYYYSVGISLN